jgi:hypothetical protein
VVCFAFDANDSNSFEDMAALQVGLGLLPALPLRGPEAAADRGGGGGVCL